MRLGGRGEECEDFRVSGQLDYQRRNKKKYIKAESPTHITQQHQFSIKRSVCCEVQVSPLRFFYRGAFVGNKTHGAASDERWEKERQGKRETHQAEVMSVNMVALGIHIPRHDMVAITWKTEGEKGKNEKISARRLRWNWGFLDIVFAVFVLPARPHSPRWSRSSYCWARACRCRHTPLNRPAWTLPPWKWARSTGWCRRCPTLEGEEEKLQQISRTQMWAAILDPPPWEALQKLNLDGIFDLCYSEENYLAFMLSENSPKLNLIRSTRKLKKCWI